MKRRNISLIIFLMSFALLGVIATQYYFLKESYNLKSQLFDQSVNGALKNVSFKLEKNEAAVFLSKKAEADRKRREEIRLQEKLRLARNATKDVKKIDPAIAFIRKLKADQAKSDSLFKVRDSILRNRYPNILVYNGPIDPQSDVSNIRYDIDEYFDDSAVKQSNTRDAFSSRNQNKAIHKSKLSNKVVIDSIKQYVVVDPLLGPVVRTLGKPNYLSNVSPKELAAASKVDNQEEKVKDVKLYLDSLERIKSQKQIFDDIALEFQQANVPLNKRVQQHFLDSLLHFELLNNGITLKYNYKIESSKGHMIFINVLEDNGFNFNPENSYKTVLFPRDMVRESGVLMIDFPDKNSLILSNMNTMLGSSLGLLIILLGCFTYTISTIIKQKKISEMKHDFINNMTHEFKTPVATIMIASEALKDPEVNEDQNRVKRLAGIIYDENVRLGNHIEHVLNLAKLEKDEYKLESNPVNINDLISAVTDSMSLQLQKKNANVILNLEAQNQTVLGDELHLSNVIFNLIDNANKYSSENPEIKIKTFNRGKDLFITVADKGIGMTKEQQKKIFDQFYRIPTGNLHDVKGFGLGLNYVSTMVKKMNGTISVRSEKDKGSEFELKFHTV